MTKGQALNRKKIRDPSLREYLDLVKEDVKIQDESDEEFMKQANKFYNHRNANNGYGNLVDDVTEEITELPELKHGHMQEFAFRYAMEPRSISDWAIEFKLSRHTLSAWLKRKDVSRYITLVRRNRFLRFSIKRVQIDELAMEQLKALLAYPINDDNFESKRKLVMEVLMFNPKARKHIAASVNASEVANAAGKEYDRKMRHAGKSNKLLIEDKSEMDEIEEAIAMGENEE